LNNPNMFNILWSSHASSHSPGTKTRQNGPLRHQKIIKVRRYSPSSYTETSWRTNMTCTWPFFAELSSRASEASYICLVQGSGFQRFPCSKMFQSIAR
jgi:hypothetical protein